MRVDNVEVANVLHGALSETDSPTEADFELAPARTRFPDKS